jgi:hypothetical protein
MLILDFLQLFLESELLSFSLDIKELNDLVGVKIIEDLSLVNLILLELGNGVIETKGLKQSFDVLGGHIARLLLILVLFLNGILLLLDKPLLNKGVLSDLVRELLLDDLKRLVLIEDISELKASDLLLSDNI